MSTTLTNGLRLPDKGSVDWYADMQNNYAILDGAVGTVAEHTTALAGKAPLVHTHTKSDITDLFNSANVWTEANTFSKALTVERNSDTNFFFNAKHTAAELGSLPSSDQALTLAFKDKNDDNLCYARVYYETTGGNSLRIFVRNKYASGAPSTSGTVDYAYFGLKINPDKSKEGVLRGTFRPYDNNTYDLGSSSYQWNNLYAKNYYYNGVAWGLDKTNVWGGENTYTNILLTLKHTALEVGVLPAFNQTKRYRFTDKNNADLGWLQHRVSASGDSYLEIYAVNKFSNGQFSPQGSDVANSLIVGLHSDGTRYAQIMSNFVPAYTNLNCNLGTSTNKWKTLNGVNPGALSFPEGTVSNANTTFNPDLTNWLTDGTGFIITAQVTGWLHIRIQNSTGNFVWVKRATAGNNQTWGIVGNSDTYSDIVDIPLNVPVIQGYTYTLKIKSSRVSAAIFMCLGNV